MLSDGDGAQPYSGCAPYTNSPCLICKIHNVLLQSNLIIFTVKTSNSKQENKKITNLRTYFDKKFASKIPAHLHIMFTFMTFASDRYITKC